MQKTNQKKKKKERCTKRLEKSVESINKKISRSISKRIYCTLGVGWYIHSVCFVFGCVVLLSVFRLRAPSEGCRILHRVVVTIHSSAKKKSWHVTHGCNILTPCFLFHTFSPHMSCFVFFFLVTWQHSEINRSLYSSFPGGGMLNMPRRRRAEAKKRKKN